MRVQFITTTSRWPTTLVVTLLMSCSGGPADPTPWEAGAAWSTEDVVSGASTDGQLAQDEEGDAGRDLHAAPPVARRQPRPVQVAGVCAPAPDAEGVCCRRGTTCETISRDDCLNTGATWLSGETCPSTRCRNDATGACCLPDCTCDYLSASDVGYGNQYDECASLGGHYLGTGTSCDDHPCVPTAPAH